MLLVTVPGRSAGLTFDADGNLYVTDRGPSGIADTTLYKVTPDGVRSTFATELNDTQALAFGPTIGVPEPASFGLIGIGAIVATASHRGVNPQRPSCAISRFDRR